MSARRAGRRIGFGGLAAGPSIVACVAFALDDQVAVEDHSARPGSGRSVRDSRCHSVGSGMPAGPPALAIAANADAISGPLTSRSRANSITRLSSFASTTHEEGPDGA